MSEFFFLISLVEISVFCVAFFAFNLFLSFKISSLSTNEKLKGVLELQFSLIAIMLGWVQYLAITLTTGSVMEADIGFCSLYCGVFRFWKEIIQNLSSFFIIFKILVPSTSVVFSLDITFLDSNGSNSQILIIPYWH